MASLFAPDVPAGFHYRDDFLSVEEEAALLAAIERVQFSDFEMRGVVARRRVAFFGRTYDDRLQAAATVPEFLFPLRAKLGEWAGLDPARFAMALINQYPPGAPIGWHRDAPQYDVVAGASLLSACRMRFRPYQSPAAHRRGAPARKTTHETELLRRSAYVMTGDARQKYEHSIPPVDALRYSITFRSLR